MKCCCCRAEGGQSRPPCEWLIVKASCPGKVPLDFGLVDSLVGLVRAVDRARALVPQSNPDRRAGRMGSGSGLKPAVARSGECPVGHGPPSSQPTHQKQPHTSTDQASSNLRMDRIPPARPDRASQADPDYNPRDLRARRPPPPDPARRANNTQPPPDGGPRRSSVAQLNYLQQQRQEQHQPPPQPAPPPPAPAPAEFDAGAADWKADDEASRSHQTTHTAKRVCSLRQRLTADAVDSLDSTIVLALYGTVSTVS